MSDFSIRKMLTRTDDYTCTLTYYKKALSGCNGLTLRLLIPRVRRRHSSVTVQCCAAYSRRHFTYIVQWLLRLAVTFIIYTTRYSALTFHVERVKRIGQLTTVGRCDGQSILLLPATSAHFRRANIMRPGHAFSHTLSIGLPDGRSFRHTWLAHSSSTFFSSFVCNDRRECC